MSNNEQEDRLIEETANALRSRGHRVHLVSSQQEARELVSGEIGFGQVVGIGDSATVRQIEVIPELYARNIAVVNPFTPTVTGSEHFRATMEPILRRSLGQDVYLTSVNVITVNGELLSIDRVGNRVAGMIFGAPKVILVVGKNKITRDLHEGYARLKNVIVPAHATRKDHHTPCVIQGTCNEYNYGRADRSKSRMCNITVLIEGKPLFTDVCIVLVKEDLGLGWDPSWPPERVAAIKEAYRLATWVFTAI